MPRVVISCHYLPVAGGPQSPQKRTLIPCYPHNAWKMNQINTKKHHFSKRLRKQQFSHALPTFFRCWVLSQTAENSIVASISCSKKFMKRSNHGNALNRYVCTDVVVKGCVCNNVVSSCICIHVRRKPSSPRSERSIESTRKSRQARSKLRLSCLTR